MPAKGLGVKASAVRVRPMRSDDLDAVMAVETRIYPFPWTRGNFADSLGAGYDAWCFIDASGHLLGYAVLMWAVDEVHLLNLAVDAPNQRQGLGERFLRWILADAASRGALSLLLEVRPSNPPAIRLYERLGLARIGLRRGYYPATGGTREDAIVMRRAIDRAMPDPANDRGEASAPGRAGVAPGPAGPPDHIGGGS